MRIDARDVVQRVDEAHRHHWATVLAATVRLTRDLDLAEDCAQEAFVQALRRWPDGLPDNPVGWLTTVAKRQALDERRREQTLRRKLPLLLVEDVVHPGHRDQPVPADPLRLVFTCCHPALSRDAQLSLTLRLMCGLTTAEAAKVLLVKEATVAARITRAKQKIATAAVPFRLPSDDQLPARLDTVLTIVHLAYTAGHTSSGPDLIRPDLTGRAVGLARLLVAQLPAEPEALGLLALLLFAEARGSARLGPSGELVLLADQDRSRWDTPRVHEALGLATRALAGGGRFALQAAIAGLHMSASSWDTTNWQQVVRMYDALLLRWPSPVVALNRLAATSLVPGADLEDVLGQLDVLARDPTLERYAYLSATRADVLSRLGRQREARAAYDQAIELTDNETERRFLRARRSL